jgi:hypothetical protein
MRLLIFVIALALPAFSSYASIGNIGQVTGSGVLERGKDIIDGTSGTGVQSMDTAVTAKGRMRIDFVDDTRVDITEHSRLIIDEFVYDPANNMGKLSIKASLGTVRYASGQIAKKYKQNVKIRTPSATIGVRGTDFVMLVDELGGSMITLLPSCDDAGLCYTGEIQVETDVGTVVLNQAFQATMTSTRMKPPAPAIKLDLDERLINQLLILRKRSPYEEEDDHLKLKKRLEADFLGVDFLEFDGLDGDALTDSIEGIWATALDESDYLLGELLHDMIDQLNMALAALFMDELSRQNKELLAEDKTVYGFDANTGIRLEKQGNSWVFSREDNGGNNFVQFKGNQNNSYTIDLQQGDFQIYDYRLGTSSGNDVDIVQVN